MKTYEQQGGKSIQEILKQHDAVIATSWPKLGSLIMAFEQIGWHDASDKARELIRTEKSMEYVGDVREFLEPKAKPDPQPKKTETPTNSNRDVYSMNYKRLLKIIPDLEEQLANADGELHGKSYATGYMDLHFDLVAKNKRGFYVALSHYYKQNGDMVADPDMVIRVDVKNQTVEALSYQDAFGYKEVYDNYMNPQTVKPKEQKAQNSFLTNWLNNLKNQGHQIEFDEPEEDTSTKPQQRKADNKKEKTKPESKEKPDVSYMDENVIADIKGAAQRSVLDDLIKILADKSEGNLMLRPVSHYFFVERINSSPLGVTLPYPKDEDIRKDYQLLVEQSKKFKEPDLASTEKTHQSATDSEVEETAKNWMKLAAVIRDVEGLDMEASKEKALALKESGKAEDYVIRAFNRRGFVNINDLLKTNYKRFLQLIPEISNTKIENLKGILKQKKSDSEQVLFEGMESVSARVQTLSFQGVEKDSEGLQFVAINNHTKKVWLLGRVGNFDDKSDYQEEQADTVEKHKANKHLGEWIEKMLNQKFKATYPDPQTETDDEWDDDANSKIPDFEPGKVELVEAHIKAGLDQKDIDWINKNERGMTITPVKNMNNKTKNFEADAAIQALKPGFRISKTGKLYRENRSNRSDITNKGL